MKIGKKTILLSTVSILLFLLLSAAAYDLYTGTLIKVRYENITGIARGLEIYSKDNGALPPLDQWCDKLIEEADCSTETFQGIIHSQQGRCGYALNVNAAGKAITDMPEKMVLVFEAKDPWNLSGGPELMKQSTQKSIAVVFADGYMDFVTIDEVDSLKWLP